MKSFLRKSKASGTARRKIEKLIRAGWEPGVKIGDALSRRRQRKTGVGRNE
jgi:hypothetical protein